MKLVFIKVWSLDLDLEQFYIFEKEYAALALCAAMVAAVEIPVFKRQKNPIWIGSDVSRIGSSGYKTSRH